MTNASGEPVEMIDQTFQFARIEFGEQLVNPLLMGGRNSCETRGPFRSQPHDV